MIHRGVEYSGGITGCRKIADYAALTRTPMGMHGGSCSLVRFHTSMHLAAVTQNFFKVENALCAFRGNKQIMAEGPKPAVRKSLFPVSEGRGLDLNEDWLRACCERRQVVGITEPGDFIRRSLSFLIKLFRLTPYLF
jgi:L-alanine-DL-glutamate epimerase-like enolase superfamily enzyme